MDWLNIGINSLISLIISMIMFAFGVRSGKERTERLKLRDKYKELYSHFNKLRDGIMECKPLDWDKFMESAHSSSKPPCKEMMKNGEHIELHKSLFPLCVELEKDCLTYGWHFKSMSKKAGETVVAVLEQNEIPLLKEKYSIKTDIIKTESEKGMSYFPVNPASFISLENKDRWLQTISERETTGINFTYNDKSTVCYSIYIRPCDVAMMDVKKLFNQISESLNNEKNDFISNRDNLISSLGQLLSRLSGLIKEPHSFWSTLINTFRDFASK